MFDSARRRIREVAYPLIARSAVRKAAGNVHLSLANEMLESSGSLGGDLPPMPMRTGIIGRMMLPTRRSSTVSCNVSSATFFRSGQQREPGMAQEQRKEKQNGGDGEKLTCLAVARCNTSGNLAGLFLERAWSSHSAAGKLYNRPARYFVLLSPSAFLPSGRFFPTLRRGLLSGNAHRSIYRGMFRDLFSDRRSPDAPLQLQR